jgi:hypothetical protein
MVDKYADSVLQMNEVRKIDQTRAIKIAAAICGLIDASKVDEVGQVNNAICIGVRARSDYTIARPDVYTISRTRELEPTIRTITATKVSECHRARAGYIRRARLRFLARAVTVSSIIHGCHNHLYSLQ